MKAIWTLILLGLSVVSQGCTSVSTGAEQAAGTEHVIRIFPNATEVRLFIDTEQNDPNGHLILAPANGHKLTADQRETLEKSLIWNENYGKEPMAACFIPHHFFQYFDAKHRKLGEIAVCFCCAGVEVDKANGRPIYPLHRLNMDYPQVKALVRRMGEPTDIECSDGDG